MRGCRKSSAGAARTRRASCSAVRPQRFWNFVGAALVGKQLHLCDAVTKPHSGLVLNASSRSCARLVIRHLQVSWT